MAKYSNEVVYNIKTTLDSSGITKLQTELNRLKASINSPKNQNLMKSMGLGDSEIASATAKINHLQTALTKAFNPALGKLDLTKLNASLQQEHLQLQNIVQDWAKMGTQGQRAMSSLAQSLLAVNRDSITLNSTLSKIATTMGNTVRWGITAAIWQSIMGSVSSAVSYMKQLDESLTQIQMVTNNTSEDMRNLANYANEAAQSLATTTVNYTNAIKVFTQEGFSLGESKIQAELAVTLANASEQDTATTADQITAYRNAFGLSIEEMTQSLDKIANLANHTAANVGELMTAAQRSASVAASVGASEEQFIASIATIQSITRQSAEEIGNGLKTIYQRFADIKVSGKTEDGVDYGEYATALKRVGVDVLDATGEFKGMEQIFSELQEVWGTLSETMKVAVGEKVAGKFQYNRFAALMNNPDYYNKAYSATQGAEGTMETMQEEYTQSIEGRLNSLRAASEGIVTAIFNQDDFEPAIEGLTKVANFIETIVDAADGASGVFGMLAAVLARTFSPQIANNLQNMVSNIQAMSMAAKSQSVQAQVFNQFGFIPNMSGASPTANFAVQASSTFQYVSEQSKQAALKTAEQLNVAEQEYLTLIDKESGILQQIVAEFNNKISRVIAERQEAKELLKAKEDELNAERAHLRELKSGTPEYSKQVALVRELEKEYQQSYLQTKKESKEKGEVVGKIQQAKQMADKFNAAIQNGSMVTAQEAENFRKLVNELKVGQALSQDLLREFTLINEEIQKKVLLEQQSAAQLQKMNMESIMMGVTSALGGIMSIYFGITMLTDTFRTLSDESATAEEKLNAVFMGGLMGITMLVPGLAQIPKVIGSIRAGVLGLATARIADAAAAKIEEDANYKEASAEVKAAAAKELSIAKTIEEIAVRSPFLAILLASITGINAETVATQKNAIMNDIKNAGLAKQIALRLALFAVEHPFIALGVALAGAATLVAIAVSKENSELNKANKAYQEQREILSELRSDYSDLQTSIEQVNDSIAAIQENETLLEDMARGTQEWSDKVQELNRQIMELIAQYPELAAFLTTENGVMSIDFDSEGYKAWQQQQEDMLETARTATLIQSSDTLRVDNERQIAEFNSRTYRDKNDNIIELNISSAEELLSKPLEQWISEFPALTEELTNLYNGVSANTAAIEGNTLAIIGGNPEQITNISDVTLENGQLVGTTNSENAASDEEVIAAYSNIDSAWREASWLEIGSLNNNQDSIVYNDDGTMSVSGSTFRRTESGQYEILDTELIDLTEIQRVVEEELSGVIEDFDPSKLTINNDGTYIYDDGSEEGKTGNYTDWLRADAIEMAQNEQVQAIISAYGGKVNQETGQVTDEKTGVVYDSFTEFADAMNIPIELLYSASDTLTNFGKTVEATDGGLVAFAGKLASGDYLPVPENVIAGFNALNFTEGINGEYEGQQLLNKTGLTVEGWTGRQLAALQDDNGNSLIDKNGDNIITSDEIILNIDNEAVQAILTQAAKIQEVDSYGAEQLYAENSGLRDLLAAEYDINSFDEFMTAIANGTIDLDNLSIAMENGTTKVVNLAQAAEMASESGLKITGPTENLHGNTITNGVDLDGGELDTILEDTGTSQQTFDRMSGNINSSRTEDLTSYRSSLQEEFETVEQGSDRYDELKAEIAGVNEQLENCEEDSKDLAARNLRLNKGVKDLTDNWDDWSESLQESNKGSAEYYEALGELDESISNILNIDTGTLSDEFLTSTETMELFQRVAAGDLAAIEELRLAATNDIIQNMEITPVEDEDIATIKNELSSQAADLQDYVNGLPLELQTTASLDDTEYVKTLNQMIVNGQITAEQATQALSSMGVDAHLETRYGRHYVPVTSYEIENPQYENGVLVAYKQKVTTSYKPVDGAYSILVGSHFSGSGASGVSSSNPGPKKSSGGGGGGGSKKKTENKMTRKDNKWSYLNDVNDNLDRSTAKVDKLNDSTDRLFGNAKIKNLRTINSELTKQNKIYASKQKLLEDELRWQKTANTDSDGNYTLKYYAKQAGVKLEFDADGSLKDGIGLKISEALRANYNKQVDRYNRSSQSDSDKEALDKQKEIFEGFFEAYSRYNDTLSELDDVKSSIYDNTATIQDNNDAIIDMKKDMLDGWKDMLDEWRDYQESHLRIFEEGLTAAAERDAMLASNAFKDLLGDSSITLGNIDANSLFKVAGKQLQDAYTTYLNVKSGKDTSLTEEQAYENLQDALSTVVDYEGELADSIDDLRDSIDDMIDLMADEIEARIDQYDAFIDRIESITDIASTVYGEDSKTFYAMQQKASGDTLNAQQGKLDTINAAIVKYSSIVQKLQEKGHELTQEETEQLRDAQDELTDYQQQQLETQQEMVETLQQFVEAAVGGSIRVTADTILGMDKDWAQQLWESDTSIDEQWLDDVNRAAEVQKLQYGYQKLINDTSALNAETQGRIAEQMREQLGYLRDKNELSQYDVDYANAQLDILQKQIALEDAQNNKSQMRLQRDASGNYNYMYTANQDDIVQKQQELLDARLNAYNITKQAWLEARENMINAFDDADDKLTSIVQNMEISATEKEERITKILENLQSYIQNLSDQTGTAGDNIIGDMNDISAIIDRINKMKGGSLLSTVENYASIESRFADFVYDAIQNNGNITDSFIALKDSILEASKQYANGLGSVAGTSKDELGSALDATGEAIDTTNDSFDEFGDTLDKIESKINSLIGTLGVMTEAAKTAASSIADVVKKSTQSLVNTNVDVTTSNSSGNSTGATDTISNMTEILASSIGIALKDSGININDEAIKRIHDAFTEFASSYAQMSGIQGFDTGGYTGTWGTEGRLALLHQKELVLNADETQNILEAVQLVRQMRQNAMSPVLDISKLNLASLGNQDTIEQRVEITANFPDVQSSDEIRSALLSLADTAYVNAHRNY